MRYKVTWITFWTTLAFWLGGGVGCATDPDGPQEQNYKMLEEDRPLFDTEPISAHPLHVLQQMRVLAVLAADDALADDDDTPVITITDAEPTGMPAEGDRDAATGGPAPAADEAVRVLTDAPPDEMESQVQTEVNAFADVLDRSNWTPMVTGPSSGVVTHGPVYFRDVTLWAPSPVGPSAGPTPDADASFSGAAPAGYLSENPLGLLVQPAKFGLDLATMPFRMIVQPPWVPEHTPPADWPQ